jgi:hypothetical protein
MSFIFAYHLKNICPWYKSKHNKSNEIINNKQKNAFIKR